MLFINQYHSYSCSTSWFWKNIWITSWIYMFVVWLKGSKHILNDSECVYWKWYCIQKPFAFIISYDIDYISLILPFTFIVLYDIDYISLILSFTFIISYDIDDVSLILSFAFIVSFDIVKILLILLFTFIILVNIDYFWLISSYSHSIYWLILMIYHWYHRLHSLYNYIFIICVCICMFIEYNCLNIDWLMYYIVYQSISFILLFNKLNLKRYMNNIMNNYVCCLILT